MAIQIEVHKNGTIVIDGIKKEITDLTQEFLEELVTDSLEGEVVYSIEGDLPIASFFRTIRDGTGKGSELRALRDEVRAKEKSSESAGELPEDEPSDGVSQ
ncbi:MAG: hypothetical protein UHI81_01900 [Olegusella sp.]|nr:hypothetical protein [Olegusella sp.]